MSLSVSCAAGGRIGAGLFVALGWCWRVDSNHRPTDYESVALPAELRQPAYTRERIISSGALGKTARRLARPEGLLRAGADNDVDAFGDRSLRQRRQADHADMLRRDVGEPSGHDVRRTRSARPP